MGLVDRPCRHLVGWGRQRDRSNLWVQATDGHVSGRGSMIVPHVGFGPGSFIRSGSPIGLGSPIGPVRRSAWVRPSALRATQTRARPLGIGPTPPVKSGHIPVGQGAYSGSSRRGDQSLGGMARSEAGDRGLEVGGRRSVRSEVGEVGGRAWVSPRRGRGTGTGRTRRCRPKPGLRSTRRSRRDAPRRNCDRGDNTRAGSGSRARR